METKCCTRCDDEKKISEFPIFLNKPKKNGVRTKGIGSVCKKCRYSDTKKWRDSNPEKSKASCDNWIKNNIERHKKNQKDRKERNKETLKKQKKEWDFKNKERTKQERKENIDNISDRYIMGIICSERKISIEELKNSFYLKEIIETRRLLIKIKREIKKQTL